MTGKREQQPQRASKLRRSQPRLSPIIFDGRYIQDRYHGIGRYAFHLVQELAKLLPAKPLVIIRDPRLPESRFDWSTFSALPNVTVHQLTAPPFSAREQRVLPLFLRQFSQAGTTLYHTPYFALPWLSRTPAVVTVHDCIFEHNRRYMPQAWARGYYRLLMRRSLARARAVLVPSAATAADVSRFYHVPAQKLVITPEAADRTFQPVADTTLLDRVRQQYSLPATFVLAVGARRPHKNFARLVEAIAPLDGAALVFVSEADERFPDEAAQAARGLGDKVRFVGKVPEADLPAFYTLATVFACPSQIEGFGLPVLEALACGAPVICSDIPSLREVGGEAVQLVPPDDTAAWSAALSRVISEPSLRTRLRAAGLARAQTFTWQRTAQAVLPLYQQLGLTTNTTAAPTA